MNNETWKPIEGTDSKYEVSNNGTRNSANGFTFRYKGGDANARSHKTTATTGAIPE